MRQRPGSFPIRIALLAALAAAALLVSGCSADARARCYAGDDRDEWQQPSRVVDSLDLAPGDVVADLGSGGGYFTFYLAEAVGPRGRVYAVDIAEDMNDRLEQLASERGADNVSVVLAALDDPKLPEPVDLVFTSNSYHHIENRPDYFRRAARYLKSGGRIAILDYKQEGLFQFFFRHASDDELVKNEMREAGYSLVAEHDWLERQHLLIFELD